MLPPFAAAVRRKLLAQPGITPLPVCGACGRETQPRDYGREQCKRCEAERAAVSAEWEREQWELTHPNAAFSVPAEPMFDSDDAARPFLPEDQPDAVVEPAKPEGHERQDRFTAFIHRLAETKARARAGEPKAMQIDNEYRLAMWCGHRPDDALEIAELTVAAHG